MDGFEIYQSLEERVDGGSVVMPQGREPMLYGRILRVCLQHRVAPPKIRKLPSLPGLYFRRAKKWGYYG